LLSPGKSGCPRKSSAKTHPADHVSIAVLPPRVATRAPRQRPACAAARMCAHAQTAGQGLRSAPRKLPAQLCACMCVCVY